MTCIVGMPDGEGGVIMGGDSAGVAGWDLTLRADEKVFASGPFVMGFTTSFRMGQLLRYKLDVPEQAASMGDVEYMATVFIDAVRTCLSNGGWSRKKDEREEGGTFIVGYKGAVYVVGGDFQVGVPASGYAACGCGDSVALGSLHATEAVELSPNERVQWALEAAEAFSAGVRGPFCILTTDG